MLVVIGDVHGHIEKLERVLCSAGLIDADNHWTGKDSTLWFMGDYFDRGPDGIAVIDLIMRLQNEAPATGGFVGAILGNHDVHILAAHEFGDAPDGSRQGSFLASWHANGGEDNDLTRLEPHHIDWLKVLPAMTIVEDRLLAHADATFYSNYGKGVTQINESIGATLNSTIPGDWDALLDYFSQRRAFMDRFLGRERASRFLKTYGGRQFVHAHTPIARVTGQRPGDVREAYVYAGGLCIDVDPGLYLGGPGFATRLDEL
ncbi:MAG: metallophosphoesterase [Chloroflexota bacterium]